MKSYIKKASEMIKSFEGFRANAYRCPAGKLTIGYGRVIRTDSNGNPLEAVITTREKEETLLIRRLLIMSTKLLNVLSFLEKTEQIAALLSFIYNVGEKAFYSSTLCKKLKERAPMKEITSEILRWNKVNGKVNKGLTNRRNMEAMTFCENTDSSDYTTMLNRRVLEQVNGVKK